VSHLPAEDWRVGVTFFVSALLQGAAFWLARRHFASAAAAPVSSAAR
jgi:MFS transporter, DHA1 family, tetracycline resistance protein